VNSALTKKIDIYIYFFLSLPRTCLEELSELTDLRFFSTDFISKIQIFVISIKFCIKIA